MQIFCPRKQRLIISLSFVYAQAMLCFQSHLPLASTLSPFSKRNLKAMDSYLQFYFLYPIPDPIFHYDCSRSI